MMLRFLPFCEDDLNNADSRKNNRIVLELLSHYINLMPDAVTPEMIKDTKELCGFDTEEAFRVLFAGILDVYDQRDLRRGWFSQMFKLLDFEKYENDPYKKNIVLPEKKLSDWEIRTMKYKPYELFVYDDLRSDSEGRILPCVGFFDKEYSYPAVLQGGREWMLITPNEMETMRGPISDAFGNVVTYGLGLGYFAYMVSEKNEVSSVTVVEKDPSVIELFKDHILPQFPNKEKISIACADALEYAAEDHPCDFVFADIWHDPSDGCDAYLHLKSLERRGICYAYWIENTIKFYI